MIGSQGLIRPLEPLPTPKVVFNEDNVKLNRCNIMNKQYPQRITPLKYPINIFIQKNVKLFHQRICSNNE
jgi:hypothetical protein